MITGIAVHLASTGLYLVVLAMSLRTLWLPQVRGMHDELGRLIRALLILSACLALAFTTLQVSWAVRGEFHALDTWEAVLWLVFDWSNGASHLAFVMATNVWLQWRTRCNCDAHRCNGDRLP